MKFSYRSGQRPLEGYTLKRGIGRGGFGEVYFAVSDGGKEVALKLVRSNQDIELRGVAQCLNLKHPNLVGLYDLRKDGQGDHWVVMEHVSGEPLNAVLARHPNGLPPELAREWFLGLARGVAYLHDHGIVHRDLKPANVFIENGLVKVGDYGLSKSMSSSQRSPNTGSVGTVHYMAPEISTGNYNKQIDTYACGVLLYEMLTGHVPFEGDSAAEILMKHLTTPPDLGKVPSEWVPILARALAKNPAQRFATMTEFARVVEKVGQAEPRPAAARPGVPRMEAVPVLEEVRPVRPEPREPVLTVLPAVSKRAALGELCGSMALAVLFAALGVPLWATLTHVRDPRTLAVFFFLTVACSWAVLVPGKLWTMRRGDPWPRRLTMLGLGALVGLLALWLEGWRPAVPATGLTPTPEPGSLLAALVPSTVLAEASYLSYYGLAFFALRWWRMTDRRRERRFSFAPLLGAGFWGLALLLVVRPHPALGAGVLILSAAVVQLVSPWQPPVPAAPRRLRLRYA
jgi:hypothetical protein